MAHPATSRTRAAAVSRRTTTPVRCTLVRPVESEMKNTTRLAVALLVLLGGAPAFSEHPESSADAKQTYADVEKTLGSVPGFIRAFPEEGVSGAWQEMKSVQLSDKTALPPKVKELIGFAVAAQVPCQYCVYFHTQAAKANGATDEEVREAVAMAAITRHWSTVLNGSQIDFDTFRKETDAILHHAEEQQKAAKKGK